ncbi:hypothetical protein K469DRAFT_706525 [Zopfia rhizophila CBS 207.26]|uniref:Uncharacterized protein n=1 Tax=Zopfia rhizophila CBS 207.26 TaxID=1314779 RepID=A0A6A6E6A5_9PEZI|nr:hypothetical protein K469DRAFT_706525 [Zopfia rhizophila CBS 207.26]
MDNPGNYSVSVAFAIRGLMGDVGISRLHSSLFGRPDVIAKAVCLTMLDLSSSDSPQTLGIKFRP